MRYPIVRTDPVIHQAPIFRPVQRGARKRGLEIELDLPRANVTVQCFKELDIADQDLLLCLLAIATDEEHGKNLDRTAVEEGDGDLMDKLDIATIGNIERSVPALRLNLTSYAILEEMQRKIAKTNYTWLNDALKRLAGVSFWFQSKPWRDKDGKIRRGWSGSFNLLSYIKDDETGECRIGLNPVSAAALLGGEQTHYIRVNRAERHQLKHAQDRALHNYLSGVVRVKESRTLSVESLRQAIYGEDQKSSADTIKKQRQRTLAAAKAVGELEHWKVTIKGKGSRASVAITRTGTPQIHD